MKKVISSLLISTFLTMLLLVPHPAFAGTFSTFKENQLYALDGRWIKIADHFLFKINEGNANEEMITFKENSFKLDDKVKYHLCFKIKKNCHLNCEGEVLQQLRMLSPWEEMKPVIADHQGAYPVSSEKNCR